MTWIKLNDAATGDLVSAQKVNEIHSALRTDMVGRGSFAGVSDQQKNGTVALPWQEGHFVDLFINGVQFSPSISQAESNTVVSGQVRSTSNQPAFITPSGSGASATVNAASTDLVININGTRFTLTSDIALSSLTLAPSTNNTALINGTNVLGDDESRTLGEYGHNVQTMVIDTAGSEFTSRVGSYHAIQINNGVDDEYFLGYIQSSTEILGCFRGWFLDSSLDPINRITISNNDTLTIMSTGWVFVDSSGTAEVIYNQPQWGGKEPSSPSTGDHWFDTSINEWKRYNGTIFVQIAQVLLGIVVLDDTDCVAARSFDFFTPNSRTGNIYPEIESANIVTNKLAKSLAIINNNRKSYEFSNPSWDITTDLATSADLYDATEQSSTFYYLYLDENGDEILSDIEPQYRQDKLGWFFPSNTWRCLGQVFNNSGSTFDQMRTFPGNAHDQAVDKLEMIMPTGVTFGIGFATLSGWTTGNQYGTGIIRSTDSFHVTQGGLYHFEWRYRVSVATAVLREHFVRIQNTTRSIQIDSSISNRFGATTGSALQDDMSFEFTGYIEHPNDDHTLQFNAIGTADVTLEEGKLIVTRVQPPYYSSIL